MSSAWGGLPHWARTSPSSLARSVTAVTRVVRRWGDSDARYLQQGVGTACRAAGVPGRVLHDFRRTAVRNLLRAGVAERVAMQMVGWKSRQMLDRYHIVNAADLIEAAKKLDASRLHPHAVA